VPKLWKVSNASGLTTTVEGGIGLTVGAQILLNFSMKVSDSSQKVEVTGEAPTVQPASSEVIGVVTERTVEYAPNDPKAFPRIAQTGLTLDPIFAILDGHS